MLDDIRARLDAPAAQRALRASSCSSSVAPQSAVCRAQHAIDCRFQATSSIDRSSGCSSACGCRSRRCARAARRSASTAPTTSAATSTSAPTVEPGSDVDFDDLIAIAESSGSAVIYPLLKRVDERHVTMQAYDSPTFVEDVVRNAALESGSRSSGLRHSRSRPRTRRASTTTPRSRPSDWERR